MSSQDTGAVATITDEELELDILPEGVDDPMVLRQQLEKEANARRQLTARAKKAEDELKQLKSIQAEPVTTTPTTQTVALNDEVVDLRLDGYSKDEVAWIMANGGRKSIEDSTSYTSIAINAKRDQLKAEQAASGTPDTVGLSEVERKYTPQQLAAMSVKELETILPHAG